jgi:hypothetical protein
MKIPMGSKLGDRFGSIRSAIAFSRDYAVTVEKECDLLISDLRSVGLDKLVDRVNRIKQVNRTPVSHLDDLAKQLDEFIKMIPDPIGLRND